MTTRSKSPSVEIEDEDIRPRKNIPPKNPQHILEPIEKFIDPSTLTKPRGQHSQVTPMIVDDSDVENDKHTYPIHTKKSRKRLKEKATLIGSSDDANSELDQGKISSRDSDIEEIKDPKESPEEELGKFFINDILKKSWSLTTYVS